VIKYSWLAFLHLSNIIFILSILLLSFQFEWIVVFGLLSVRYPSAFVVGFSAKIKRKKFTILVSYNGVVLMFTQMNIFISNLFQNQSIGNKTQIDKAKRRSSCFYFYWIITGMKYMVLCWTHWKWNQCRRYHHRNILQSFWQNSPYNPEFQFNTVN
jgi:hypothetical protein